MRRRILVVSYLRTGYSRKDYWNLTKTLLLLVEMLPDDFVPYIEYKPNVKSFQWIGAGRDSDSHLLALCARWMDNREDAPVNSSIGGYSHDLDGDDFDLLDDDEEGEMPVEDTVPPPRFPTNWTVRPSTDEERLDFQVGLMIVKSSVEARRIDCYVASLLQRETQLRWRVLTAKRRTLFIIKTDFH